MEPDPYARIATWYDLEHDSLTDDVACYAALIAPLASGHAHVLEIGSGTGRTAAALAMVGCHVTGVEPSAAMRAACARRLAQLPEPVARRITITAGAATNPLLAEEQRFDVVLYGLNTFAHLTAARARHAALAVARRHLARNGLLLLDLDVAGMRRLRGAPGRLWWQGTWPLPDGGEVSHFLAASGDSGDMQPRVLALRHFYDVTDGAGILHRVTASMRLAILQRGQMERSFARAGFVVHAIYGTYDLAPYEAGAPRALFVAKPDSDVPSGSVK
ncbi:MAG: class I SAM-dependent methyltransferase [Ktedonobacterales bacterium]